MPQLSYSNTFAVGIEGGYVDTRDGISETFRNAESSAGIPVGRFVKKGTGDKDALLLSTSTDELVGITVQTHAMDSVNQTDVPLKYAVKAPMTVAVENDPVWMKTEQDVTPADPVYARYANGASTITERGTVRKDADTNGARIVPGARFLGTATANGLVAVSFSRHAHKAALYGATLP